MEVLNDRVRLTVGTPNGGDGRFEAIRNRQLLLPTFIVELHGDEFRRESGSHELVENGPGTPNMA